MEDVVDYINIPRERIAVLLGKKGVVKKRIEKECDVKIKVDSESGGVEIIRKTASKDPILSLAASEIVRAIARGFAPQKAFKLLLPDIYVEIIDLPELISNKNLPRVRGRIIGEEGKAREYISRLTGTDIVIYGKTVGIIGDEESVRIAKDAILKLIGGSPHPTVFRFVERHRKR
jgi:ribosomal RNA assembly protein